MIESEIPTNSEKVSLIAPKFVDELTTITLDNILHLEESNENYNLKRDGEDLDKDKM